MTCRSLTVKEWKLLHGYWTPHPLFDTGDWQYEVANNDTRQGYWDWATLMENMRADEERFNESK